MHFIPIDPKLVRKHERIAQEKERKAQEELERGFQEYVRKERIATLTRIGEGMRKDGKVNSPYKQHSREFTNTGSGHPL